MQALVHSTPAPLDSIIECRSTGARMTLGRSCLCTWRCECTEGWPAGNPLIGVSIIEMTAGIAVLCMPAMAALFKRYSPVVTAHFSRSNNSSHDTEQETFYEMTKTRKVVNPTNARDCQPQSSNKHAHMATSSSDSAFELRPHTSDSATLAENLDRPSISP